MNKPVVLITGALAGIGRATAFAFAREGARVVVSGRNDDAGESLAKQLRALGGEAEFVRADVTREDDVRALVEKTLKKFGRLDVAVNNAGTEGKAAPIVDQTIENYTSTFNTNVLGVLLSLKYELKAMTAQGSGSIINVSSIAGQRGLAGVSVYVASKHAVDGLTKTAALEGAPANVRVNAVAPGPIDTGMLDRFAGTSEQKTAMGAWVPLNRIGRPEEVAQAIVFLASEKSPFVTGQTLGVDGGKLA